MHYAFISILLVLSLMDILLHQRLGFAPMALFYAALKIQADRAADIFLKYGLVKPISVAKEESWIPPSEKDPFGGAKSPRLESVVSEERTRENRARHDHAKKERAREEAAKARTHANQTKNANTEKNRQPAGAAQKPVDGPAAERQKPGPFRAPKFHGAPHEVLGVNADANTNVIVKAFRHWIKEFHPDHCKAAQEMRRATDRARTITTAKDQLLDRRRQMRKAA